MIDITFIKSYENGEGYEFNNNESYFINDQDTSFLNFKVTIHDNNGIESIQSIRYSIETFWYNASGECGCPTNQTCTTTSPTFYMKNIDIIDDTNFIYEAINEYIENPGFPVHPTSVCDRYGVITFSFFVFDIYFGPLTFVEELFFSPCSEGSWNCESDCEFCPSVCGECNE